MKRILIAGIGNIFKGDDAFGVEVVSVLMKRKLPSEVQITDFGIRSYDLAFELTEPYEAIIFVDATARGEPPGTTYLIELNSNSAERLGTQIVDGHSLTPETTLQLAHAFGKVSAQLFLVGCEPAFLESEEGQIGLSPCVSAAVPQTVTMIEDLLSTLLAVKRNEAGFAPA